MNFAVDAAANAASKASSHSQVTGKVILSISDAALYQAQGSTSSCKISIFYTNPLDQESVVARTSEGADICNNEMFSVGQKHDSIRGDNMFPSSSFGERGGSMTRRTRLRESIERGMTTYQREKLGLGLSLVHHLVSAQGSDLRYEIVADETMTKFWFLLPMSLDFPERLNAEMIMKDDMQGQGPQLSACRPLKRPKVPESMAVAPYPSNSLNLTLAPEAMHSPQSHGSELSAPSTCTPAITVQNAVSNTDGIAETRQKPKKYPGVAPGARPLVLVVEDTDVSASLLCMHLRKLNCTSHRAENGEVALEMLRSAPDPSMYSLVLMDLRMPVMDGFEAAEIIKGSIASNIPIVALTGETSEEHKKKCDEIGFDDYQTKPLKRPQLKELLNKFVPGYQCPP
jgi:CheY-like chemotaxis protein